MTNNEKRKYRRRKLDENKRIFMVKKCFGVPLKSNQLQIKKKKKKHSIISNKLSELTQCTIFTVLCIRMKPKLNVKH